MQSAQDVTQLNSLSSDSVILSSCLEEASFSSILAGTLEATSSSRGASPPAGAGGGWAGLWARWAGLGALWAGLGALWAGLGALWAGLGARWAGLGARWAARAAGCAAGVAGCGGGRCAAAAGDGGALLAGPAAVAPEAACPARTHSPQRHQQNL